MKEKYFWLATRDGKPCGSFKSREEAVGWLKSLLKQSLKDFDKQDRPNEFDYEIVLKKIEIRRYEERQSFLGL